MPKYSSKRRHLGILSKYHRLLSAINKKDINGNNVSLIILSLLKPLLPIWVGTDLWYERVKAKVKTRPTEANNCSAKWNVQCDKSSNILRIQTKERVSLFAEQFSPELDNK